MLQKRGQDHKGPVPICFGTSYNDWQEAEFLEEESPNEKALLTPGPTPVPEETLLELAKPVTTTARPSFARSWPRSSKTCNTSSRRRTRSLPLDRSGHRRHGGGASSTASPPGGKAICLIAGRFGERWRSLCKAFGVEPIAVDVPYGQAVQPEQLARALAEHPDAAGGLSHAERDLDRRRPRRPGVRQDRRQRRRPCSSSMPSAAWASWNAAPTPGTSTCASPARKRR